MSFGEEKSGLDGKLCLDWMEKQERNHDHRSSDNVQLFISTFVQQ